MMTFRFPAIVAAIAVGACATSAMAAGVTAKLQAPVAAEKRVVAGGAIFNCAGDTCMTASPGAGTLSVKGCRELVRETGAVSAFGAEAKALDADKIAACNAWASGKPSAVPAK